MKYRDLKIWQKGMDIVELVYKLTKELPTEEKFGLISQMRRCSVSIPSNIAEGYGRKGNKELIQFLNIARGSLNELETQLEICKRLQFFDTKKTEILEVYIDELYKMIFVFQKKLPNS